MYQHSIDNILAKNILADGRIIVTGFTGLEYPTLWATVVSNGDNWEKINRYFSTYSARLGHQEIVEKMMSESTSLEWERLGF